VAAFAQLHKITSATPGYKKSVLKNQYYKIHFNLYLMNALNPFKPASYERTKSAAI